MSDAEWGARIDALEAELRGVTARVEAALRAQRQSDTLAREYSAMQERTQRHAQDMEAAMLRWQQRAEAAEAMLAATFVSENRALDVRYEALDNERAADAHNEILRQDLQAATARAEAAERELESMTPGGSEYHANPARCAAWVQSRLSTMTGLAKERNELRQRALAAEAKLAAVPVDALRRCFAQEYDDEAQWAEDTNIVQAWLAQQSEARP